MLALLALGVFLATAVAIRAIIPWLRRRALIDAPNHRSSHVVPTPRGGGLALVAVLLVAGLGGVTVLSAGQCLTLVPALIALLLLAVLSIRDDVRSLPVRTRLAVHLAAVMIGMLPILVTWPILLPGGWYLASLPVIVIGWVWYDERVTLSLGLGATLIVAGILINLRAGNRVAAQQAKDHKDVTPRQ